MLTHPHYRIYILIPFSARHIVNYFRRDRIAQTTAPIGYFTLFQFIVYSLYSLFSHLIVFLNTLVRALFYFPALIPDFITLII